MGHFFPAPAAHLMIFTNPTTSRFVLPAVAQHTNPPELPISGDPTDDITLELVFPKGKPTFLLDGKSLRLIHPLDRDEENLSHIVFQVGGVRFAQCQQQKTVPLNRPFRFRFCPLSLSCSRSESR